MTDKLGSTYYTTLIIFFIIFCFPVGAQRTVGLFTNTENAFNGYTLLAPTLHEQTYLIDNCGRKVHVWSSDFAPGLVSYLLPNGDLLRATKLSGFFSGGGVGGGAEFISWEGEKKWQFEYATTTVQQHHDVEYLPNGNVLLLAWELLTPEEAATYGVKNPSSYGIWPEHIIEVKPIFPDSGEIVWEWHFMDHIIQDKDSTNINYGKISDHPELVDVHYTTVHTEPDFVHANAIDYHPELDQIMISSRNYSEFWVIDHSTTTEEAASHTGGQYGKGGDILYRWGNPEAYQTGDSSHRFFYGQHDAHWIEKGLPNEGSILVFNNGVQAPIQISKVHLIAPNINEDGSYPIISGEPYGPLAPFRTINETPGEGTFFAPNVSGAQMLPNGNVLVTNGRDGYLREITPDTLLAWKYNLPVNPTGPIAFDSHAPGTNIFRSYRYGPDYEAFEGRDLTPGEVIELNAPPSDCMLFINTGIGQINHKLLGVSMQFRNQMIEIVQETPQDLSLSIYDMYGRQFLHFKANQIFNQYPLPMMTSGIYIVSAVNSNGQVFSQKFFLE